MRKWLQLPIALLAAFLTVAAVPAFARSHRVIDDNDRVRLHGNVHPHARPEFSLGATDYALPMERMIFSLKIHPSKQAELDRFIAQQQDPSSADYHKWLSPEEYGLRFGPDPDDLADVSDWLTSHGFTIDEIGASRTWINFSGSVATVENSFQVSMNDYLVDGQLHHANSRDPSLPRGLTDLASGVVSLHNFPRKTMNNGIQPLAQGGLLPEYTSAGNHYLSPGDFAAIYNLNPLYSAGIDGTGQTIAIVGRTHPSSSNWATFRSKMGLPVNPPQVIVNGPDPGNLGAAENGEADLDVEWAGAVARNAAIKLVISRSTFVSDGVDLSAQYIVNHNLAPIMSTSFGQCESEMGATGNAFYNNLWQQAAAQGITSFVSSGDSGAAGCNGGSDRSAFVSGVNGLASTPYNTAVGGTQFDDGAGTFWNSSNLSGYTSAIDYIPEVAWNESASVAGGRGLWSTSGGISSIYSKPTWQVSPGVPVDGRRDVPDLSLAAAGQNGYLVQTGGALHAVGGTSASTPALAGIAALIVQKTGQRLGNANSRFYQLGNAQYSAGGVKIFNDVVSGNNSVPGVTGFEATTGYDLVTGLGSVDATALVNNWLTDTAVADLSVAASSAAPSVSPGSFVTVSVNSIISGGFNSDVALAVSGLPNGITATFTPASIVAPGSGTSELLIVADQSAAAGSYPVMISAVGGGLTRSVTVTLTVMPAGTILLNDGFEGTGWSKTLFFGSAGKWTMPVAGSHSAVIPHGGSRMADFNSYTAAKGSRARLYRTAKIAVPAAATTVTLRFWMYHDTSDPLGNDLLQAQVSTNRLTWNAAGSPVNRYNGTNGWSQVVVDLGKYRGKNIYIGFLGISRHGNDIFLDDVTLTVQ